MTEELGIGRIIGHAFCKCKQNYRASRKYRFALATSLKICVLSATPRRSENPDLGHPNSGSFPAWDLCHPPTPAVAQDYAPYCSSLTCSIHSTGLPLSFS